LRFENFEVRLDEWRVAERILKLCKLRSLKAD